jgi:Zn-finger nucleic acid-binding protein
MPERYCPRCLVSLRSARSDFMTVDMCTGCGGTFFDHGELAKIARKHAAQFEKLEALVQPNRAEREPMAAGTSSACPGCAAKMESYEYAYCSGITLDRCPKCSGIWVDEGELKAIGRHIEGGDKLAQEDADRIAPYLASLAGPDASKRQMQCVSAVVGMLNRPVRESV